MSYQNDSGLYSKYGHVVLRSKRVTIWQLDNPEGFYQELWRGFRKELIRVARELAPTFRTYSLVESTTESLEHIFPKPYSSKLRELIMARPKVKDVITKEILSEELTGDDARNYAAARIVELLGISP